MTVSTTTARVQLVYTGAGDYDFLFQVNDVETDLIVTHIATDGTETDVPYDPTGSRTTLSFTATIDPSYNGTVAVVDGDGDIGTTGFLRIERVTSLTQVVDWLNAGPMNMDTLEECFDKLTMICQELDDKVDSFSMTLRNQGDWAASTDYEVGDLVLYSGVYYVCMVTHTSSGTFTSSYWSVFFDSSHTHTVDSGDVTYDNAVSGLSATKVKGAIDEVAALAAGQPERFRGTWDASTTTHPDWADPAVGDYGYISVAGTIDAVAYSVGDKIMYTGSDWVRIAAGMQGGGGNLLKNAEFRLSGAYSKANDAFPTREAALLTEGSVVNDLTAHRWYIGLFQTTKGSSSDIDDSITITKSGAYFYIKGMDKYRGHMYQILYDGAYYAGRTAIIQADISAGTMDVYVVPRDLSPTTGHVNLAAISGDKIGTLSTSVTSIPFTFPALAGGEDCYEIMLVDNMDGTVTWPAGSWATCCLFKDLMLSLGGAVKQFIPKTLSEYEDENLDTLEYSWPPAGTGYNSSTFMVLPRATTHGADITSLRYLRPKLATPTTIIFTPADFTASRINCAGTSRAISMVNANRLGLTIRNNSSVTLSDQSYIYYHYFSSVSLY